MNFLVKKKIAKPAWNMIWTDDLSRIMKKMANDSIWLTCRNITVPSRNLFSGGDGLYRKVNFLLLYEYRYRSFLCDDSLSPKNCDTIVQSAMHLWVLRAHQMELFPFPTTATRSRTIRHRKLLRRRRRRETTTEIFHVQIDRSFFFIWRS